MILDTDNEGNLVIRLSGEAGAAVLTPKDGRLSRYEERQGVMSVSDDPGSGEMTGMGRFPDFRRN